ncbi:CBU_0592 family membrane protein [Nocardioides pyridinolyticus]
MTVVIVNVVGWLGMALLVSAYALVTAGRMPGTGLLFQLMNLSGGAFLMVNSAWYSAWPSAALNLVWVVIGVVGLARAALRTRPVARGAA